MRSSGRLSHVRLVRVTTAGAYQIAHLRQSESYRSAYWSKAATCSGKSMKHCVDRMEPAAGSSVQFRGRRCRFRSGMLFSSKTRSRSTRVVA